MDGREISSGTGAAVDDSVEIEVMTLKEVREASAAVLLFLKE